MAATSQWISDSVVKRDTLLCETTAVLRNCTINYCDIVLFFHYVCFTWFIIRFVTPGLMIESGRSADCRIIIGRLFKVRLFGLLYTFLLFFTYLFNRLYSQFASK